MKVKLESRFAPDGTEYWSLTVGKIYEVLGIECDWYRLLDNKNEPVLFDPACFTIIDATEPSNWVSIVDDDARYAYPREWGQPGFFEDWHDGVAEVREAFRQRLEEWHPDTAKRLASRER